MKESDNNIPLNPIFTDSTESGNESDNLISTNISNKINTNNNNIISISSNNYITDKKQQPVLDSPDSVKINYNSSAIMPKIEDKIFLCYKRRKFPKNLKLLYGFFWSLGLFIFFSILFHILIANARNISSMTDSIRSNYNNTIIAMYIFLILSILSLVDASTSSPGRQRGTPLPPKKFENAKIKKIVGGKIHTLKYCYTCNLIRDVRTFHCNKCDLCVEKHDHHCGYTSNCVGAYNYKKFFLFVILGYTHITIVFITCVHFSFTFGAHLDRGEEYLLVLAVVILLVSGFFEIFIFSMILQHVQIILINRTTREFIKKLEFKEYNRGWKRNCKEALCQDNIKEI